MKPLASSRARRLRRAAVTLAALPLLALLSGATARADAAFTLTSSAQGVSLVVSNASIPLITSIQVATPTAQASANSSGQTTSYSAAPDPGQGVAELPIVAAGQICAIATTLPGCSTVTGAIPAYPYAYAQAGDPPQDKDFAGAHLHAEASDTGAKAQTTVGAGGVGSATSTAIATSSPDGSVDATAETSVDALAIGTYLRLSGIHASAAIHRDPSGAQTSSSSFDIGALEVNGLKLGFGSDGFTVLGTVVPQPIPTQTVLDAFKAIGVTATLLPPTATKNGITSEGLSISYTVPGPPSGVVPPLPALPLPIGVGVPTTPTTVTYTLGQAAVTSTYKTIPGDVLGGTGSAVTGGPSPVATPSSPAAPISTGGAPAPVVPPAPVTPPTTDTLVEPSAPVVAAPAPAPEAPQPALATQAEVSHRTSDIYLALVITALAVFGAASALRFLGVRLTWTS
ncbi:MAG TPA: hypothetical protein VHE83_07495 [Mycobacteriales bacterium]|nr:hypothetical protein [Mycobacteriales bacterium]